MRRYDYLTTGKYTIYKAKLSLLRVLISKLESIKVGSVQIHKIETVRACAKSDDLELRINKLESQMKEDKLESQMKEDLCAKSNDLELKINKLESQLKEDLCSQSNDLELQVNKLENQMKEDIGAKSNDLELKINKLESQMKKDICAKSDDMELRINKLEEHVGVKLHNIEQDIHILKTNDVVLLPEHSMEVQNNVNTEYIASISLSNLNISEKPQDENRNLLSSEHNDKDQDNKSHKTCSTCGHNKSYIIDNDIYRSLYLDINDNTKYTIIRNLAEIAEHAKDSVIIMHKELHQLYLNP